MLITITNVQSVSCFGPVAWFYCNELYCIVLYFVFCILYLFDVMFVHASYYK